MYYYIPFDEIKTHEFQYMKRPFTLLLVLLMTNIPISCIEDDCGSSAPMDAKITDLSSSVGTFNSEGFSNSNFNDFKVAAILVTLEEMTYTEFVQSTYKGLSLLNVSYACSPVEPKPTHTIQSISITSDSAVFFSGIEYVPGENLNELFKITRYSYINASMAIDEFVANHKNDPRIFGFNGDQIVFQLKEKPDKEINQSFNFEFAFSDSKVISLETSNFNVIN